MIATSAVYYLSHDYDNFGIIFQLPVYCDVTIPQLAKKWGKSARNDVRCLVASLF